MTTFDPRTVHSVQAQQFGTGSFGAQSFPSQPFPGPVQPPPLRPSRPRRPVASKIVAGLVAAGLVVGGAGTWMALSGSSAEAAVQATSFAGADPTTNPFGTDAPQVAAVAATGPQAGDTKGLFAATDPASCDSAAYLKQLQADPAKLAAVGGVFGLGAKDVPAFIGSLSPVVLRANTSVTDHPYADGAFSEQKAILAAGTAVLVNSYGEPTVKCFNGNPLTGGAPIPGAVTVTPTTQAISTFQFTNVDNSRVVVTPGKPDPKPNKGPNPDPFLQAKADAAKQLAENARKDATTARGEATKAADAQKEAQDKADGANTDFNTANENLTKALGAIPFVQANVDAAVQKLQEAATAKLNADIELQTAKDKATDTDKKAKDLEDKATADEQAAKQAQQDSDDSKHPELKRAKEKEVQTQDKTAKVTGPTTVGPDGQLPIEGQTPTKACGIADAATTECTPPTGTADTVTGTTPATGTTPSSGSTTGTTPGTSTGSAGTTSTGTGSSSSSSSSTSSSSTSSSQTSGSGGGE